MLKATQVTFPSKPMLSTDGKDFIRKCLTYNMEARWDISDAYLCSYLNKH
jgi:tousled-like kinase